MSSVWIFVWVFVIISTTAEAWVSNPQLMTSWRWRYNISRGIDDVSGAFTLVRMHVLDVDTPLWALHSSALDACTLVNETQAVASVTCSSPIHLIIQVSDQNGLTDQFSIRLVAFVQDLAWMIAADFDLMANTTTKISIWLHDALNEKAADAITSHMFESGESPSVSFSSPSVQAVGPVTFNATRSRWIVPIEIARNPSFTAISIQGIGVSFMTYQAKDAYLPLFIQHFLPAWDAVSVPSAPPGSLHRDICAFSIMAFPYSGTNVFALTQNLFNTMQALRVPLDVGEILVDIAFTRTKFLVLTQQRVLYSSDMQSLSQATGVDPSFNFSTGQLRVSEMCDDLLLPDGSISPTNDMVLLFNSDFLYASLDGGVMYSEISFPSTNLKIIAAILEYRKYLAITAAFRDGSNAALLYEYDNGSWIRRRTSSSSISNLKSAGFGTRNSFVLGSSGLMFSPNSGSSISSIRMTARSPSERSGLRSGESIKQLMTLPASTSYAVLTSMNRVFYGIMPLMEMIEVQSGIPVNSSSTFLFFVPANDIPGLKIATSTSTGIRSRDILLEHELRGVRASPRLLSLKCPYQLFSLPQSLPTYIDMGDNITVLTVLKDNENVESNAIAVAVDDSNLLRISSSTSVSTSELQNKEVSNVAVIQGATKVYSSRIDREIRATGTTAFSIMLLQGNHACGKVMAVTRVKVGCPPGISISVRDYASGIPIRVFHLTTGYRPTIDLYNDGAFVREMTGDYVLQELSGRNDHQYTATAAQVGCIRRPQSWERLKGSSWTSQNNIDCFSHASSGVADGSDWTSSSYEIINSTGKNMLKFKNQADDGCMIFQVTVVDLEYSYCNLSTVFMIELYGRPLDTSTAVITIVGLAAFMLIAFTISYLCYRREIMMNRKFD